MPASARSVNAHHRRVLVTDSVVLAIAGDAHRILASVLRPVPPAAIARSRGRVTFLLASPNRIRSADIVHQCRRVDIAHAMMDRISELSRCVDRRKSPDFGSTDLRSARHRSPTWGRRRAERSPSCRLPPRREYVDHGADQRQVGERLREVAQVTPPAAQPPGRARSGLAKDNSCRTRLARHRT